MQLRGKKRAAGDRRTAEDGVSSHGEHRGQSGRHVTHAAGVGGQDEDATQCGPKDQLALKL